MEGGKAALLLGRRIKTNPIVGLAAFRSLSGKKEACVAGR
jgi:hypothetical protein